MAKPPKWHAPLLAAQSEAVLAVNLYNHPTEARSFEGFVVHMHLAWLYLLQAKCNRDNIDNRYHYPENSRYLEKIDGEVRLWDLARSVKEHWPDDQHPIRRNVEFFIGLRNKLEHRFTKSTEALSIAVAGKAQSFLLNFESELVSIFGTDFSLSTILRFPVFIGTFTVDGEETMKKLRSQLPPSLKNYIAEFHSGLTQEIADDPLFELRLKVVLEKANRDPEALAMSFLHWNDMSEDQRMAAQALGRTGQTVIREQVRPIANAHLLKISEIPPRVSKAIPFQFTKQNAICAWQKQEIRPKHGAPHPERTVEQYCVYDRLGSTYGYTEAWVQRLIKKCATAEGFLLFTGCHPIPHLADRSQEQDSLSLPKERLKQLSNSPSDPSQTTV